MNALEFEKVISIVQDFYVKFSIEDIDVSDERCLRISNSPQRIPSVESCRVLDFYNFQLMESLRKKLDEIKEVEKTQALSKLTPYEIELLGLKK